MLESGFAMSCLPLGNDHIKNTINVEIEFVLIRTKSKIINVLAHNNCFHPINNSKVCIDDIHKI